MAGGSRSCISRRALAVGAGPALLVAQFGLPLAPSYPAACFIPIMAQSPASRSSQLQRNATLATQRRNADWRLIAAVIALPRRE